MIKQKKVHQRMTLLRKKMQQLGFSAYIIPTNDPHLGEYLPEYWKQREWLSGFSGSVGTLVVLEGKAAMWTDSRYYLQAEKQLSGTGIDVIKMSEVNSVTIPEYLSRELRSGCEVGLDAKLFSVVEIQKWQEYLQNNNLILNVNIDLIDKIWTERTPLLQHSPYIHDVKYAGLTLVEKVKCVQTRMDEVAADMLVVTALDEIAWLLNIRGSDVKYNPFFLAYCLVEKKQVKVFIAKKNLSAEIQTYFSEFGIAVFEYADFELHLSLIKGERILLDNTKVNYKIYQLLAEGNVILYFQSPVALLKTRKNEVEIDGIRRAMIKDAVALVKWNMWLESCLQKGEVLTELSVAKKIKEYRAGQSDFVGESFAPIVGYGSNGAIVHYNVTEETNRVLKQESLLLVDSGGHYLHGTTDITRTIALGKLTAQQKKDYTLVLKGHIALARASFPQGTRGGQLDVLARQFLWEHGLSYGHGSGHGVGCFLAVHEGPVSIRPDLNPTLLEQGMVLSDEPGIYRENEYGIRIENLLLVVEKETTDFGNFMSFEVLTLFPIDVSAIDFSLMNENETNWLNEYHSKVYTFVSPFLNNEENKWLKTKCKKIK